MRHLETVNIFLQFAKHAGSSHLTSHSWMHATQRPRQRGLQAPPPLCVPVPIFTCTSVCLRCSLQSAPQHAGENPPPESLLVAPRTVSPLAGGQGTDAIWRGRCSVRRGWMLQWQLLGIPNPLWQLPIPRSPASQKFSCFFYTSFQTHSSLYPLSNPWLLFNPAGGHNKQNVTLHFLLALSGLGQTPSQQRQFWKIYSHTLDTLTFLSHHLLLSRSC